jgi:membrane protease YdiL (CAAX protease family)
VSSWIDRLFGPVPDLPEPRGLDADRRAAVVLWSSAILLVLLVFRGGFEHAGDLNAAWAGHAPRTIVGRLYWFVWGFLAYLAIPVAIIVFVFKESPARYGLRWRFTRRTTLLYVVLFLAVCPLIFYASTQEAFLRKYPMVRDLHGEWDRIVLWEAMRSLRFLFLEFFFRGFLVLGLQQRMGYHAIAIGALPYGLLHYAKPFPEAMAAVVAAGVLGLFAIRTRSVAAGAILHAAVAMSMDFVALWRKGAFG